MKPDLPIDTQILWLAAELVEKGHCKGALRRENAFCALGALKRATYILGNEEDGRKAAIRLYEKVHDSVVLWNDHPSRTAEEVALALRTA